MPIDEDPFRDLMRRAYRTGELASLELEPEEVRAQARSRRWSFPDVKVVGIVVAAAALIIAGILVIPDSHSGRLHSVGGSSSTLPASSTSTTTSAVLAATLACVVTYAPGTSQPETSLVGMTVAAADAQASTAGQTTRIVGQDGTCNIISADLAGHRVDLWVVNGVVVKAVSETPPGSTSTG